MAIEASELEEKARTATMMVAWVTGSVLISKTSKEEGSPPEGKKGSKESVGVDAHVRGRNLGQCRWLEGRRQNLHGSWVKGKTYW
jgi:hypothetical protein